MLSIDFGGKKVCIVEGNYRNGTVAVTAIGEIEYPSEVVVNGNITDRPALSFLINEIIKKNHMKSKDTVATINSSEIIAREFKLPDIKLQDLKLLVSNEMSRITKEDSGFLTDFVVTGVTSDKMLNISAYAVTSGMVESYYNLLRELKLIPTAFDLHANSMSKLLSNTTINGDTHKDKNFIVVDIGYSKLSFYGFTNGFCRFTRTEVSPVQEFIREIESIIRLDVTEKYMSELNLSPEFEHENPVLTDTCKYFIYRLSEEIQKYIQYLIMNSESKSVEKIYICGGIASGKEMDTALTDSLKIQVERLKKIGRLSVPENCNVARICNAVGALIRQ
jgi:Tfp pilus assembly protein, ATPase PilM